MSDNKPIDRPIDAARAEMAINYLARTDEPAAELKVDTERADLNRTKVKAAIFTHADGTVEDRKAISLNDNESIVADERYFETKLKYETLKNRRSTAVLVWEHWRSKNSAMKQGIVV